MDREFLEDYDQREYEEWERYVKWVIEDGSGSNFTISKVARA